MTTYDPPVNTYVPLASTDISSGTSNINFAGLDAYDTYQIHITGVASGAFNMRIKLNNSTGSVYQIQTLGAESASSTAYVSSTGATTHPSVARGPYCVDNFHMIFTIYNCQDSSIESTIFVEGYRDDDWVYFSGVSYAVTDLITQIDLSPDNANTISSGHVAIYGLGI